MNPRNVRMSIALTVAEFAALDWYANRVDIPTSSLGRTLVLEALLPRLQRGTLEGDAYATEMATRRMATVEQERGQ